MTTTQLEAGHNLIVNEVVATIDRETNTEEEDTPLYRRKLQKILVVNFIAAPTRKYKNKRPLVNFVRKRDWDATKLLFGGYWYNIRNRLQVKDDQLLIDDRIVLPIKTQADCTGQPTSHAYRFCGHAGPLPKHLVSRYTHDHSTNGAKM